ncbi:unnamed protein product [Camellia sinensis]
MVETLSSNPLTRTVTVSHLQSPTSPFFLGSNDNQLERAQAHATRAAAVHKKPATTSAVLPPSLNPYLDKQQILKLFQNCIKLISENKINQKNTSGMNLIRHLFDIIKVEEEDDVETNFQK